MVTTATPLMENTDLIETVELVGVVGTGCRGAQQWRGFDKVEELMAALGLHSGEVDAEVSNDNVYVFGGNPDGLEGECQHFAPNAGRAVKCRAWASNVSVFLPRRW